MAQTRLISVALFAIGVLAVAAAAPAARQPPATTNSMPRDYRFDGKISRQVLENYLSRSVSFTELLHDDLSQPRNSDAPRWFWANTRSDACPNGSNTEQTIREIWAADAKAERQP